MKAAYGLALALWLVTRVFVLVQQSEWPWINARVVGQARDVLAGSWSGFFGTPPLPQVLAVPLVAGGLNELQAVAGLYLLASLVQFGAFAALLWQLFPHSGRAQVLALALFLLLPINHSIHHFRNVATVLASGGVFLLASHWLRATRPDVSRLRGWVSLLWAFGAVALGGFSRLEALAFPGYLLASGLFVPRARAAKIPFAYAAGLVGVTVALVAAGRLAGAGPMPSSPPQYPYGGPTYLVYTFLDSTPASWLSAACRANPSEDCRVRDGAEFFGPQSQPGGLAAIVAARPGLVLAKTAQSALDNVWELFGSNPSTYPGLLWGLLTLLAVSRPARDALRAIPGRAWLVVAAALGVSIFPLSWAPPYPQYHLQTVLPVVAVGVPALVSLARLRWGEWALAAFWLTNVALSAFRYTRYAGY